MHSHLLSLTPGSLLIAHYLFGLPTMLEDLCQWFTISGMIVTFRNRDLELPQRTSLLMRCRRLSNSLE